MLGIMTKDAPVYLLMASFGVGMPLLDAYLHGLSAHSVVTTALWTFILVIPAAQCEIGRAPGARLPSSAGAASNRSRDCLGEAPLATRTRPAARGLCWIAVCVPRARGGGSSSEPSLPRAQRKPKPVGRGGDAVPRFPFWPLAGEHGGTHRDPCCGHDRGWRNPSSVFTSWRALPVSARGPCWWWSRHLSLGAYALLATASTRAFEQREV